MKTLNVDGFDYLLKDNQKIIGLVVENVDNFELIIKPTAGGIDGNPTRS